MNYRRLASFTRNTVRSDVLRIVLLAVLCFAHLYTISVVADDSVDSVKDDVEELAPSYAAVPKGLKFKCKDRLPGYYADVETRCQVWHWCVFPRQMYSFLCPNGTVFNQAYRVCDWFDNVDCGLAEELYSNNKELYH